MWRTAAYVDINAWSAGIVKKADQGLKAPKGYSVELERGNPAVAERILELLADGPMRPSALRKAVGIRSSTHFNRYYLSPLQEKGIIAEPIPIIRSRPSRGIA